MSATYEAVEWIHDRRDEPVLIYMELDAERNETRKVEVFSDGSKGWADAAHEVRSKLSERPIPALAEIAAESQFRPRQITRPEFETAWASRRI